MRRCEGAKVRRCEGAKVRRCEVKYISISKKQIYRLLNTGALVLVSTYSKNKRHDIAPIAWVCPAELDPPRVLLCMDPGHETYKNILQTRAFAVSLPRAKQAGLVESLGGISGNKTDKYEKFSVKYFCAGGRFRVPEGVAAYIECSVMRIFDAGGVKIVVGECKKAAADSRAFAKGRISAGKKEGKLIHHLGGGEFVSYGRPFRS